MTIETKEIISCTTEEIKAFRMVFDLLYDIAKNTAQEDIYDLAYDAKEALVPLIDYLEQYVEHEEGR